MSKRLLCWLIPTLLLGCNPVERSGQQPESTITLGEFDEAEPLDRPAVEFDHLLHSSALGQDSCQQCHLTVEEKMVFSFKAETTYPEDREAYAEHFHNACIGCHREQSGDKSTPAACAECHVKTQRQGSLRQPMAFDYSLHGRHSQAEQDKCQTCHHVYNEQKQALEYKKGEESACHNCHGKQDEDKTPALAKAAHKNCVNCHLKRSAQGKDSGPDTCLGCHGQKEQQAIAKLEVIPRIMRNQPDTTWVSAKGAKFPQVPFQHKKHEAVTQSCSSCHHQTLKGCKDCHTLEGDEKGKGVTLEVAYHESRSEHSCVGCHQKTTENKECAGCHVAINNTPRPNSCAKCHNGPLPTATDNAANPATGTAVHGMLAQGGSPTPIHFAETKLDPLPDSDDNFPETILIDRMAKLYQPSKFPHRTIVASLYQSADKSALAKTFHGSSKTLCAGCHHHTPADTRPPACVSCHSDQADPTEDRPSLKAAYHRQCMGCHQQMQIKALGCTDCHQEVSP